MCNPLAMMTNKMGEAIPLPGITELSTVSPRAVCTPTLTAALFTSRKQNVVHPYNGMLFGLIGEGVLTPAAAWSTLEDIMPSEISQSQRRTNTV